MCINCWREYGSPEIKNERVDKAIELIGKVYECHGAGGGLHIVLDDFNIDNDSVQFCVCHINQVEYQENASPGRLKAERECLVLLRGMTMMERASALARYHYPEYFDENRMSFPA